MLADLTILFKADRTAGIHAIIRMDEKFDRLSKFIRDQLLQPVNFKMGFTDIQVPGDRKMTINMQDASKFYDSQVVNVYPVRMTVLI